MYQQISIQYSCSFFFYETIRDKKNKYTKWFKKTLMSYTCNSIAYKMCYVLKYAILRKLWKKDINFHYLNMSLFLSSHRNITRWVE